jgi:hypothetical protein
VLVASSGYSMMDARLAEQLKLKQRTGYLYTYKQRYVRLRGLTLGGATINQRFLFHLTDIGNARSEFDAVLGGNFFASMDIEIDNAAKTISFLSPGQCKGAGVHWADEAVTLPTLPTWQQPPQQTIVAAELRGQRITVMLDTGTPTSAMSMLTANRRFGLTPNTPGVTRLNTPSGEPLDQYLYRFDSLTMSGVHFENTPVLLTPVKDNGGPDLTLGMHELRQLHLYFALGDRMVHITAANAGRGSPAQAGR